MALLEAITEIDLDTSIPSITPVHAKQYDTVRKVMCNLYDHGVKWYVPSGNYVILVNYKKSDGVGGFYDETEDGRKAVTIDGNDRSIIYVLLDRNMLTVAKEVQTEVTFYLANSYERLSTFSFTVMVESASVTELDLQSNPDFKVLQAQINAVIMADQNIRGMTAQVVETLPAESPASVTVTGGGNTDYNLAFRLPRGNTGDPPALVQNGTTYSYAVSTSGTTRPNDNNFNPNTAPVKSKYYWTKVDTQWDTGTSTNYLVSYIGADGSGAVNSVNNKAGNVVLSAEDILLGDGSTSVEQAFSNGRAITSYNKILLLGDSWNFDYYDEDPEDVKGHGWGYHLCQNTGLGTPTAATITYSGTTCNIKKITANNVDKVILVAQNSGGFAKVASSENASFYNKKYYEVIDILYNSGFTGFDLIVAQSGWNDSSDGVTQSDVDNGVSQFMSKVKQRYPNAKVYIIPTTTRMPNTNAKRNKLKQLANSAFDYGAVSTRYSYLWCAYGISIEGDPYLAETNDTAHLKDAGYNNLSILINRFVSTKWDGALPNIFESHAWVSNNSIVGEVLFEQGLKIQFGRARTDSNGAASVEFVYNYSRKPFVVPTILGVATDYVYESRVGNVTETGFDIQAMKGSGDNVTRASGLTVNWLAIGV